MRDFLFGVITNSSLIQILRSGHLTSSFRLTDTFTPVTSKIILAENPAVRLSQV